MSILEHGSYIDLLMKKRKPNETEEDNNKDNKNNKDNNSNNNEQQKKINKEKKEDKKTENKEEPNNTNQEATTSIPLIEQTNEDTCLNYLPMTNNYSISYLQSDVIDNIYCTNITDFIFTTSYDGAIQFWKKIPKGIEFVKKFKAHLNKITGVSINKEGSLLCTCSQKDLFLKIFDIINFDLFDYTQLNYYPSLCEFIIADSKSISNIIAISEKDKGIIHIYDNNKKKEISLVTIHDNSIITGIKFNTKYNICLSTSNLGLIEYWSKSANKNKKSIVNNTNDLNNNNFIFGNDIDNEIIDDSISFDFPKHSIKFKFKSQTDLFKLYNKTKKNAIINLTLSPRNNYFGVTDKSRNIYIFNFLTAKIVYTITDTVYIYQNEDTKEENIEKEIEKYVDVQYQPNVQFDESEKYLYYPCWEGIKLINLKTKEIIKILGKKEKLRFISICLFQGESLRNKTGIITESKMRNEDNINADKIIDPLLFANAFKSNRFYIFSKSEPDNKLKRDIMNEDIEELKNKASINAKNAKNKDIIDLPEKAVIDTTKGEIFIKLYVNECPKTTKNFITLGKRGYYDGLIFHRVIKNFMIQTGDPKGNGTGGESIYGKPFKDEFNENLKHEAFMVSMANAGPDTNGSQFFITTVPCDWLDNKHTVFGKVYDGSDVVQIIENTKVDRHNKPYEDIKIVTIRFLNN